MADEVFPRIWAITARKYEGCRLDLTPSDHGNWSGGVVGSGDLRGSKFGISAASYPALDISALTFESAGVIARRDFFEPAGCDNFPPAFAALLFDAAFNSGVRRAVELLQQAAGAPVDGVFGALTMAHARASIEQLGTAAFCAEFQARRIVFLSLGPEWRTDGLGFARRCAGLAFDVFSFLPPQGPSSAQ